MKIFTYNRTGGKILHKEFVAALRAVNYQIKNHFVPYWGIPATLVYQKAEGPAPNVHGDDRAVLYVVNEADVEGALGYHAANNRGAPYGFVFLDIAEEVGEPWSVTLSHEALELALDPLVNMLFAGPHPRFPSRLVFHWGEACNTVQDFSYLVNGIEVSDFVLPHYFTVDEEPDRPNHYLATVGPSPFRNFPSFGVAPGGYCGFYDPRTGEMETYSARGDKRAAQRLRIKAKRGLLGRSAHYRGLKDIVAKGGVLALLRRLAGK